MWLHILFSLFHNDLFLLTDCLCHHCDLFLLYNLPTLVFGVTSLNQFILLLLVLHSYVGKSVVPLKSLDLPVTIFIEVLECHIDFAKVEDVSG